MFDEAYKLRYLSLFFQDLEEKLAYIAFDLQAPEAADDLLDAVEKAILKRQRNAEAFERYFSLRDRRYPYYKIYVKNFVIYYVIIDDEGDDKIMEIRRFLHKAQNRDQIV